MSRAHLRRRTVLFVVLAACAIADAGLHLWFAAGALKHTAGAPATWTGAWYRPTDDFAVLTFEESGAATWTIDGVVAARRAANQPVEPRVVFLRAGFHTIAISADSTSALPPVAWGPPNEPPRPLDERDVLPVVPAWPALAASARSTLPVLTALIAIVAVVGLLAWVTTWIDGRRARIASVSSVRGRVLVTRVLFAVAVLLVVTYGALLRLDAFTDKYGFVERPQWVRSVQDHLRKPVMALHPAAVSWSPITPYPHKDAPASLYRSDPYTYLEFGREMTSFYAGHYREPVFPFVTKVMLWLFANEDFAVSAASGLFSVLLIAATYWLGSLAFARAAGLAAALLVAIECDAISWGVDGWRDEAFACAVLVCACVILRYRRSPTGRRAVVVGLACGAACLVRLTSVSFVVPAVVWMVLADRRPWRARFVGLALAATTAAIVAGPYVINCWRVYGDPVYAIDFHAHENFTEPNAAGGAAPVSVRSYLDQQLRSRIWRTVDTIALGVTQYPFENKWTGFGPWSHTLERWLPVLALIGLGVWCLSSTGRFLLLMLVTTTVPFSLTWRVAGDWRFTEYAYPLFLIAAASGVTQALAWTSVARVRTWVADRARVRSDLAAVVVSGAAIAIVYGATAIALPMLTFREALRAGEDVSITAGDRDAPLFAGAWSAPLTSGNVVTRIAVGHDGDVRVVLPAAEEYTFTLRADPFPRPLDAAATTTPGRLHLSFNGVDVGDVDLRATPGRVGSYSLRLPAGAARRGINTLTLALTPAPPAGGAPAQPGLSDAAAFALWYVRFHPVGR